jgi:hypothetical protein
MSSYLRNGLEEQDARSVRHSAHGCPERPAAWISAAQRAALGSRRLGRGGLLIGGRRLRQGRR